MLFKLFLIFSLVPVIELALLIKVGGLIGTMPTILIIVFTGLAGAFLARAQGFYVIRNIQTELQGARVPSMQLFDAAIVLVGGVLLVTPGVLTDALGFVFLIPLTRNFVRGLLFNYIKKRINPAIQRKDFYDI